MGDIADMMIDGTLCGGCGVYMAGEGQGLQRFCPGCKREGWSIEGPAPEPKKAKVRCAACNKLVAAEGLAQHTKAKH